MQELDGKSMTRIDRSAMEEERIDEEGMTGRTVCLLTGAYNSKYRCLHSHDAIDHRHAFRSASIIIFLKSVCLSVAVRSLHAAIIARSSREIGLSQTVRIGCLSFLSRVHVL